MANIIQRYEQFDASSVTFSAMKKNKNGGKTVYINAQDNKKLYLQLPFIRSPFGVSCFTDKDSGKESWSLDLSFDKDNEEGNSLKEKLMALDARILDIVAENSKEWLGKVYNADVIKDVLYKPIVRPGKEDFASTLKCKVMVKPTGEFIPEAYNTAQKSIPLGSVEKGQRCMCIVDINQIWFVDKNFGVSVRLSQVLCQPSTKLPSFAFQGVSAEGAGAEEEEEEEEYGVDEE
jgi:hypothetical protein